jgi:hypothetical protein
MCLEKPGRGALRVSHDSGQHDGTVYVAASRLLGCLHRGMQDAQQLGIGLRLRAALGSHVVQQPAEIARYVRPQTNRVDGACLENGRRVRVLREGQQQVLERYRAVPLVTRKPVRPLEAFAKIGRHWNRPELIRKRLRHRDTPASGRELTHSSCAAVLPLVVQAVNKLLATVADAAGGFMAPGKSSCAISPVVAASKFR